MDPISNMLTHMRNASKIKHKFTLVPFCKINLAILKVLKKEGYITDYVVQSLNYQKKIKVFLRYNGWWIKKSTFIILKRISKPGQRVFINYKDLYKKYSTLKYNQGIAIISTSMGIMSNLKAITFKKGGEILCYIE